MFHVLLVLSILSVLFTTGYSTPVLGGQSVGEILDNFDVIGQTKFPFMAHLKIIRKQVKDGVREEIFSICGGVIISDDAVLTAAHCMSESLPKPIIYVRAGFVDVVYEGPTAPSSWAEDYSINEGFIPEHLLSDDLKVFAASDIAIVWLETPFVFGPTIQPATLLQYDGSLTNAEGWILGWGATESQQMSRMLLQAPTQVVSNEVCQSVHPNVLLPPDVFCLLSKTKTSAMCGGDSGGPFVVGQVVYGISSFGVRFVINGNRICDPREPEVFTHVGMYKEWITEKLEERSKKKKKVSSESCRRKF